MISRSNEGGFFAAHWDWIVAAVGIVALVAGGVMFAMSGGADPDENASDVVRRLMSDKKKDTGVAPVEMPGAELRGFAVAGADRRWAWAKARIEGSTVVVSAEGVEEPVAVRYAHRANPMGDCNLYNRDGLPASPFRTDDW